jgi:hypothetical protein
MEIIAEDGSAVKQSRRGKKMTVWIERVPSRLFVGRDYLLPGLDLQADLSGSED